LSLAKVTVVKNFR